MIHHLSRSLYFIFFFVISVLLVEGQAIYYSSPLNQQIGIDYPFHIIGDIDNGTALYVYDKQKEEHGIHHFDVRMQLIKKQHLTSIPYQDKILGVFIGSNKEYLVVHVRQVDSSRRVCYLSRINMHNLAESTTKELLRISHHALPEVPFFRMTTEITGNYFLVYLIGGHDENGILLRTALFNKQGELEKQTRQILNYKSGKLGEKIEGMHLNVAGDLMFYMTAHDAYGGIRYTKVFLQPYKSKKWRNHYMGIPESVRVYNFKPFYNALSKTWNLYACYRNRQDRKHIAGFLFRSWSSETSKMVHNVRTSFKNALVSIKDQIDPHILEDINDLDQLEISNRVLQDIFAVKREEDKEDEEEKEYLDEDQEVSASRIKHLLQLFSIRHAEVIDVIPTNNDQLLVLMEEQSFDKPSDGKSTFFSKVSDNISVGLNVGIGNTYFANSTLPSSRASSPPSTKEKRAGNLIAFSVDIKTGRLSWASSIHKQQEAGYAGGNISFCLLRQAYRSLLFYVNTYAASFIYGLQLTPKGTIELTKTIRGVSSSYQMITNYAKQVNQTSLVVPCSYKESLVFARILYED